MSASPQKTFCTTLTPKGRGAVAVVAIAGPDAEAVINIHFKPISGKPFDQTTRKIVYGVWNSTGEDLIAYRRGGQFEIHCHGGNTASSAILSDLQSSNIELVQPADFVEAENDPWKTEVLLALTAANTNRTAELLLAQVELLQNAINTINEQTVSGDINQALKRTESILQWSEFGIHLTKPRSIVLCGRPNVGKSSLINAIAGFQRAIVHNVPGTTRDVVTQRTAINGWPVELKDTAGLRESQNEIETIGIEKAKTEIQTAHINICVFDLANRWNAEDQTTLDLIKPEIIVHNKSDLGQANSNPDRPAGLMTSTETGQGIEELIQKLGETLVPQLPSAEQAFPVSHEQAVRLSELAETLRQRNTRHA